MSGRTLPRRPLTSGLNRMSTRWSPDTCECILSFTMVGDVPTLDRVEQTCSAHAGLSGQAVWDAVHPENVLKNQTVGKLMALFPDKYAKTDLDGNVVPTTAALTAWSFAADRTLVIDTALLTKTEQAALSDALAADPAITDAAVSVGVKP